MTRRLLPCLLAAAAIALPAGMAEAQHQSAPAAEVVLSIGRGQLVTLPVAMSDIFVANDAVADVEVKSRRELYVMGRAGGETVVYASDAAGETIWSANIRVGSNIDSVDQMLTLAMPDARIAVATIGTGTLLLTGTVAAPEDAAEAERLVRAYAGKDANVISRLRLTTPLQVSLRVRIAEVSRSLVRALGVNVATGDSTGGFQFGLGQGRNFFDQFAPGGPSWIAPDGQLEGAGTLLNGVSPGTTISGMGRFLGLDLLGALDLAETDGLVTTLAEPNLAAISGETGQFLAGGEFPIPLNQGLGNTTVEYKNYGVSLAYTPVVLSNGRISLRVRPEVSELSSQGAVTLNGFQIPALTVRRAETTVELGSGQSFMIAGLMSNSAQNTVNRAPGLGNLPIIGNLFRSSEFRRGETELVIVVTPYLVRPVDDSSIRLPTDGLRVPTLGEQLLHDSASARDSGGARPGPMAADAAAPSGTNLEPAAEPGFSPIP
ncbi:type II and III secretion system protein family protein [Croceibacterium ferulae]|uniref:type II and III secretion system protein family protein n=1 Tax=Croceibacterium ferulae TaxID=1854641 RepID=UPI000EB4305C|nr:type II and III secretion system protein family protein [Croceibacterium ferulae]